jgi:hypothetical protein
MLNPKAVPPILRKALQWNCKPTEQSFPELPEVLVRSCSEDLGLLLFHPIATHTHVLRLVDVGFPLSLTPRYFCVFFYTALQIWFRFFIAVAYGLYLGLHQATKATYLLQSLNLVAFVPLMYCKLYLGVEGEEFGMKIVFSGLLNAIALSFLIWVYFFTAEHEIDELRLKELLLAVVDPTGETASMAEDVLQAAASVVTEESEF